MCWLVAVRMVALAFWRPSSEGPRFLLGSFLNTFCTPNWPKMATCSFSECSYFCCFVSCDQVKQVVSAYDVDDMEEAHQVDPVYQADHKNCQRKPARRNLSLETLGIGIGCFFPVGGFLTVGKITFTGGAPPPKPP